MANLDTLLPVTLPSRPSCTDCLSWSSEDLAIAGGETIHILTRKTSSSRIEEGLGHPQWLIHSFRANLFRYDEWPEQTLDTISSFSIGEEQSNSLVTTVIWSNAGLGVHKRAILGVLHTSLLLTLWETDGTHGNYRRTCLVNNFMASGKGPGGNGPDRRGRRIRSFAWTHSLKGSASPKWGLHHLVVADDYGNITFLRIEKERPGQLGGWRFEIVLKISFDELDTVKPNVDMMSPLQKRLYEKTHVSKIKVGPWRDSKQNGCEDAIHGTGGIAHQTTFLSRLTVMRGSIEHTATVYAVISEDGQQVSLHYKKSPQPDGNQVKQIEQLDETSVDSTMNSVIANPEIHFKESLSQLLDDFNTTFRLGGHVRAQHWGSCLSADNSQAVTCVSIHPTDMIQYTIPSAQRCTLVFKEIVKTVENVSPPSQPTTSISETILMSAVELLKNNNPIQGPLDLTLVRVYARLAKILLEPDSRFRDELERFDHDLQAQIAAESTGSALVSSRSHAAEFSREDPEECEICGASIPFTTDTTEANCRNGHHFSRCQLSFLAVQQPGISKYCSQCGKQFLDLMKLEPGSSPSFAQSVFDHFDSCPYCQAKFRG